MQLVTKKLSEIKPYKNNPRKNDMVVDDVAESIRQCDYNAPIVVDENNVILAGHTRLAALKQLGYDEAEVIVKEGLTEKQKKKYRLLDNQTSSKSEWDYEKLMQELDGMDFEGFDFGFNVDFEYDENEDNEHERKKNNLIELFGVPPFSVFNTAMGYWQDRKRAWREFLGNTTLGRDAKTIATHKLTNNSEGEIVERETSEFDPVLCEILLSWFCPNEGSVFDPFAGGSTRGIISEYTGHRYTGIDIREEQIKENIKAADVIGLSPNWICGDSIHAKDILYEKDFDFVMTCPPYGDLEVYSDLEGDISNKNYDEFINAYNEIIKQSVDKLADDRFAVFVVGDFRDKKGFYRGFVKDTIIAFENCGMKLYNEIILMQVVATAARRVKFQKTRKVAKIHQNVLVFYKGDVKKIKDNFGEVYIPEIE